MAAAFEEGKINRKSTFTCDGQEKVGGFTIKCHKVDGHGTITVKEAIAESCNDYMMHIGKLLGAKKFVQYQERFGFAQRQELIFQMKQEDWYMEQIWVRQHLQLTHLDRTLQ